MKFDRNGVYLQIVRQGCGSELEDGGRGTLVCRFAETNMFADSVQTCNNTPGYAATPDRMFISRATSVPYIKVGHPTSENEMCSKVRLIVPHTQGHAYSSSNVIPYYYEITYEREV